MKSFTLSLKVVLSVLSILSPLSFSFQRNQTLLKEYKEREKTNVFKDKRFGEYNTKITPEEKMIRRFTLERQVNDFKKGRTNEGQTQSHKAHLNF